jgi:hypothetical protein
MKPVRVLAHAPPDESDSAFILHCFISRWESLNRWRNFAISSPRPDQSARNRRCDPSRYASTLSLEFNKPESFRASELSSFRARRKVPPIRIIRWLGKGKYAGIRPYPSTYHRDNLHKTAPDKSPRASLPHDTADIRSLARLARPPAHVYPPSLGSPSLSSLGAPPQFCVIMHPPLRDPAGEDFSLFRTMGAEEDRRQGRAHLHGREAHKHGHPHARSHACTRARAHARTHARTHEGLHAHRKAPQTFL